MVSHVKSELGGCSHWKMAQEVPEMLVFEVLLWGGCPGGSQLGPCCAFAESLCTVNREESPV